MIDEDGRNQEEEEAFGALESAITAASSATHVVHHMWEQLDPDQQDRWLLRARITWPRRDVVLPTLLPASDQMYADELAAMDG